MAAVVQRAHHEWRGELLVAAGRLTAALWQQRPQEEEEVQRAQSPPAQQVVGICLGLIA